jgi:response regulator RpfG family c-di-GMP phosphodiesterase
MPVLIVEDEDVVAGTITRWLGGLGYEIARVSSAEQAIAAMAALKPSVAICDVGLPGKDGLWFADLVRAQYPSTAVVLATGQDDLPPARTMRKGVVSYLVKPFGCTELRNAVSEAASWHEDAVPRDRGADFETEIALRLDALSHRLTEMHVDRDADTAIERLFPDSGSRRRIDHVSNLALALSMACGLPAEERDDLLLAARLHRLWRLVFVETQAERVNALSHIELDARRRGPALVAEMVADHRVSSRAALILRSLRERFDGLGVPDRLVGDRIPKGSRILAVAEAIEAMAWDRSDRPARTAEEIQRELRRCAGSQFDPEVVRVANSRQVVS